ncbi:MAG: carboxypeptidase regulatory-like domain-containing protein, partial [Candidatus Eremiobacteraeota bacterium]|nr:carboxypeptidase regulatory-like domain-containing protein [Candidatus Eremiobacteraeota bacterium]
MRTFTNAGLSVLLAVSLLAGPLSTAAAAQPNAQIAQAQSTGTLTGTVTDQRNDAVGGATVTATGPSGRVTGTTDQNGKFSLTLAPGLWDVVVSKAGFVSSETDSVGIVAGSTTDLTFSLSPANLSSLRVIGQVTTRGGNALNTRPNAVTTISGEQIVARQPQNLNNIVPELPGVSLFRGTGTTPNSEFIARGQLFETRVFVDGHQLSTGTFGAYNTNYTIGTIFNQVEVVKGMGPNGPNGGESPIGTVNLRTRDFSPTNQAYLQGGYDGFGGSFYNVWAAFNTLKDNRLSFVFQKAYSGDKGQSFGYTGNRINSSVGGAGSYNINDSQTATGL